MWCSMSLISLCGADPKAFRRSMKVIDSGRLCCLTLSMMAFSDNTYSKTPGMPERKPFWSSGLIILFAIMNSSSRDARILWSSLPTHEVRVIGRKFFRDSVSPPLWIRRRIPLHQIVGERWLVRIIFENRVARKLWVLGSFFRWRYEIRSGPGADAFGSFLRNLLIRDGITGDMLNSVTISGLGMASSTQAGIEEYCGPLESWKVDWKCTRPTSMVKEGLASCLGWQTDLAKVHGFFLKARSCFLAARNVVARSDAFFTRLCSRTASRKPLGSDRNFLLWMFFAFASLSVSFTVALCLWGPLAWLLCGWSPGGIMLRCSRLEARRVENSSPASSTSSSPLAREAWIGEIIERKSSSIAGQSGGEGQLLLRVAKGVHCAMPCFYTHSSIVNRPNIIT